MMEKSHRWKSGEWYGSTKTKWQQPAGRSGGQSSVDAWEKVERGLCGLQSARRTGERKENYVDKEWQRKRKKRSRPVRYA